jgi:putative transposase
VRWWNTSHGMETLDGRTPLAAWQDDPTPLITVPTEDLRLFTLEDDGRRRSITTKGVEWRRRRYVGPWMTGQVGLEVRVRWMPHHDHEVEVFDADTGEHLGAATLADQVRVARPRLLPPGPPAPGWVLPRPVNRSDP